MVQPQMSKRKRDRAIHAALVLNEQVRELGDEAAKLSDIGANEMAKDLAEDLGSIADSLNFELREHVLELVSKNLGPQQQSNLMLVLKKAGQWVDAERKELQPPNQLSGLRTTPSREAARRLRDLDHFEKFLRCLARDILRAMADFNFQKNRAERKTL